MPSLEMPYGMLHVIKTYNKMNAMWHTVPEEPSDLKRSSAS
jgi:hypothetical protein